MKPIQRFIAAGFAVVATGAILQGIGALARPPRSQQVVVLPRVEIVAQAPQRARAALAPARTRAAKAG